MKVLVWTKKFELKNSGGPMGYCYNIKSYLDENPCESIDFYPSSGVVAESEKKTKAWSETTCLKVFVCM